MSNYIEKITNWIKPKIEFRLQLRHLSFFGGQIASNWGFIFIFWESANRMAITWNLMKHCWFLYSSIFLDQKSTFQLDSSTFSFKLGDFIHIFNRNRKFIEKKTTYIRRKGEIYFEMVQMDPWCPPKGWIVPFKNKSLLSLKQK